MQPAYEIPQITTRRVRPSDVDADVLIVPVAADRPGAAILVVDEAAGGDLRRAIDRGEFQAKPAEIFSTRLAAPGWKVSRLIAVGAGPVADLGPERVRRMATAAGTAARHQKLGRVAWLTGHLGELDWIEAVADGLTSANFDPGHYKSREPRPFFLASAVLAGEDLDEAVAAPALARGRIVAEAASAARLLVDEPGNRLTPRDLVDRARALAAVPGVRAEVLDEKRMEELGMGLLLGVARGSAEPPRLLVLRYEPKGAPASPTLGLVGKGITFDTGGLSLKPADAMERMKDDMAGAAAVAAAVRAIALQELPVRVIGVLPATENMPGGRATKPGDILKSAAGLTVEVNNTDAEGRLILGDGLWYARQLGATHLVDVATLTGACVVALGKVATGLFGSPAGWVEAIREAGAAAGEKVWPLPLYEDYREQLKSEIADMVNSPGRPAGAITAAMFLQEFAGGLPWAHLDIAGTAWADEGKAWQPKGATGVAVRTLVEIARGAARGGSRA